MVLAHFNLTVVSTPSLIQLSRKTETLLALIFDEHKLNCCMQHVVPA